MRLDPSRDLNAQILRATRRTRLPAPTPEPPKTSGPAPVDNGAGAVSPLAPLLEGAMNRAILRAAGRQPRW